MSLIHEALRKGREIVDTVGERIAIKRDEIVQEKLRKELTIQTVINMTIDYFVDNPSTAVSPRSVVEMTGVSEKIAQQALKRMIKGGLLVVEKSH